MKICFCVTSVQYSIYPPLQKKSISSATQTLLHMKNIFTIFFVFIQFLFYQNSFSQNKNEGDSTKRSVFRQIRSNLYGSFESNMQWHLDDEALGIKETENRLRANSYLNLNYNFLKNFTAGLQVESYAPMQLKNYYEGYDGTNLATYYLNYKSEKLDVTLGYFYEQFGNGLVLRAFEERSLGLNNALRGGKIKYTPLSYVNLTALYGRHRHGFAVSGSDVFGLDAGFDFAEALGMEKMPALRLGLSYVGRHQPIEEGEKIKMKENFPTLVHAFSARADADFGGFYTNFEYVLKTKEVSYKPRRAAKQKIYEGTFFPGNALIFTTGYTQKGVGFSATFRRLENMLFFARRNFLNAAENQYLMMSVNFLPSLVKQYSYALANIDIYQAQPGLVIARFDGRAGEIGGQIDFFYTFKKKTKIGGKYGTKLSVNFSYWSLLNATFDPKNQAYEAPFLLSGKDLNKSLGIEINKKWSKKLITKLLYLNSRLDRGVAEGSPLGYEDIQSDLLAGDLTLKFKKRRSVKIELQHLWATGKKRNWLGGGIEVNLSQYFAIYANDIFNYGHKKEKEKIHYYNFGGSFTKGATRIALNYGRQRGGLVCTGGVCRMVSPSSGFTLNINTSF